jgi:hypothetical protein
MASPPFRKKRTPLPSLPTNRLSCSAAAAAAAAATTSTASPAAAAAAAAEAIAEAAITAPPEDNDNNNNDDKEPCHLAKALPPFSSKPSGAFTALSNKPALRHAKTCSNGTLNLHRSSNREAFVAQCVGAVQIVLCKSCRKEKGPWKGCVAVDGFLVGSCANCHYGGEGGRCSFRPCKFLVILFLIFFIFGSKIKKTQPENEK